MEDEYKIIVGKNAIENWKIIDDAKAEDIWFHVDNVASCHVVLHMYNDFDFDCVEKFRKDLIMECARICKTKSKSRDEKKVKIIYTTIDNIKKTHPVGSVKILNLKKCRSVYV